MSGNEDPCLISSGFYTNLQRWRSSRK